MDQALRFCEAQGKTPDELIKSNPDWSSLLNKHLDEMSARGLSSSYMLLQIAAVKKWLDSNGVIPLRSDRWAAVDPPKRIKIESDRLPTKEELRKIVSLGDLTDRTLITLAVSSGLREGTVVKLRVGDFDLSQDVPVVRPPSEITKGRASFFTFITPECKDAIKGYLKEREMNGETITPESWLFPSQHGKERGLTRHGGRAKWTRLLTQAGLDEKGSKYARLRFHTLRKFFKTYTALSGVSSEVSEFFMGHRGSLKQTYFMADADSVAPEVLKMLEAEYRKALPALTIFSTEAEVKTLEKVVDEQRRQLEADRDRLENEKRSWERQFEELRGQINQVIKERRKELKDRRQPREQESGLTGRTSGLNC